MGFEIKEHTADVAVESTGQTIEAVFSHLADGLAATMCDEWSQSGEIYTLEVTAENREALLFDYLDELIYLRDIESVLPVDNSVVITESDDTYVLEGQFRGVPLESITAREVKAVTYADMELSQTPTGWRAYVVFDV